MGREVDMKKKNDKEKEKLKKKIYIYERWGINRKS